MLEPDRQLSKLLVFARLELQSQPAFDQIGAVASLKRLLELCQTENNLEGEWIQGVLTAKSESSDGPAWHHRDATFELNGHTFSRWYYGWRSSSNRMVNRRTKHVLRAYVFCRSQRSRLGSMAMENDSGDCIRLVAIASSSAFGIVSFRRTPAAARAAEQANAFLSTASSQTSTFGSTPTALPDKPNNRTNSFTDSNQEVVYSPKSLSAKVQANVSMAFDEYSRRHRFRGQDETNDCHTQQRQQQHQQQRLDHLDETEERKPEEARHQRRPDPVKQTQQLNQLSRAQVFSTCKGLATLVAVLRATRFQASNIQIWSSTAELLLERLHSGASIVSGRSRSSQIEREVRLLQKILGWSHQPSASSAPTNNTAGSHRSCQLLAICFRVFADLLFDVHNLNIFEEFWCSKAQYLLDREHFDTVYLEAVQAVRAVVRTILTPLGWTLESLTEAVMHDACIMEGLFGSYEELWSQMQSLFAAERQLGMRQLIAQLREVFVSKQKPLEPLVPRCHHTPSTWDGKWVATSESLRLMFASTQQKVVDEVTPSLCTALRVLSQCLAVHIRVDRQLLEIRSAFSMCSCQWSQLICDGKLRVTRLWPNGESTCLETGALLGCDYIGTFVEATQSFCIRFFLWPSTRETPLLGSKQPVRPQRHQMPLQIAVELTPLIRNHSAFSHCGTPQDRILRIKAGLYVGNSAHFSPTRQHPQECSYEDLFPRQRLNKVEVWDKAIVCHWLYREMK